MARSRWTPAALALALWSAAAPALSRTDAPSPPPEQKNSASPVGRIDVGFFLGGRTSILMRVQQDGGFEAEGLKVALLSKSLRGHEFVPLTREQADQQAFSSKATGAELLDGLSKGSWDLATAGESSFLAAVAEKKPVLAVAELGYDRGEKSGHLVFAVRKGTRLSSPGDYRGKLFVSRRAGPGDEVFLLEYLARAGVDLDRDVVVLPGLPATAAEKRALPRDKVALVYQVFEDDLPRAVSEGLIDGGFFHLKTFERMRGGLEKIGTQADSAMALLVCRRDYAETPEGRAKIEAFLAAYIKRVRLENGMTAEQRRAMSARDRAHDRWRLRESTTPGAEYPKYLASPRVDAAALARMSALLRKHKLIAGPEADAGPYVDNSFVDEAVRRLDAAR